MPFVALLLGAVALLSPAVAAEGDCFGQLDYASDIAVTDITVVSDVPTDGRRTLEIEIDVTNQTGAAFTSVLLYPDLTAQTFDVGTVLGAVIDVLGPNAAASSDLPLTLDLPADQADAFVSGLRDASVPLVVHASETPQVADGYTIYTWTEADAVAYTMGINLPQDPFGAHPWDVKATYTARLYYAENTPQAFVDHDPFDTFIFDAPASAELLGLPEGFRGFVADSLRVADAPEGGQFVTIEGRLAHEANLLQVYDYASLCTDPEPAFGGIIGATRPVSFAPTDPALLGPLPPFVGAVPIRFNDLSEDDWDGGLSGEYISVSASPRITLVVRPDNRDRLIVGIDLEAEINLTAAEVFRVRGDPEAEIELPELCVPVDPIKIGPVTIPQAFQLAPFLVGTYEVGANSAVGLSLRAAFSAEVDCTTGEGCESTVGFEDDDFASFEPLPDGFPEPLPMTIPQIGTLLRGIVQGGTRLEANFWIGEEAIDCDTGLRIGAYGLAGARLNLEPAEDPWWSVDLVAYTGGSIGFKLFGFGIEIDLEIETDFEQPNVMVADTEPPDPASNARFLSGEDHRWAIALDDVGSDSTAYTLVDADLLEDGSTLLSTNDWRIMKINRYGQLMWNIRHAPAGGHVPFTIHGMPDGTVVTTGGSAYVAAYESDGSIRWAYDYDFSDGVNTQWGMVFRDATPVLEDDGTWGLVVVGSLGRGFVSANDGAVVRLDRDGNVVWARHYEGDGLQDLQGVTVARNGDIVVSGSHDVGPDAFSTGSGWLMRLDGTNGDVRWSTAVVTRGRGGLFNDVKESPSGALYAVGRSGRIVSDSGSAWVAQVSADGQTGSHALLIHDLQREAELSFEDTPSVQVSDGAFDTLYELAMVGNDVVVVGHAGTGIRTAWAARLGPDFAPGWFVVLDGEGYDGFSAVDAGADAIMVAGYSSSLVENGAPIDERFTTLLKLPLEGRVKLHEDFSDVVLRFMSPGLAASSQAPSIVPDGQVIIEAPIVGRDLVLDGVRNATATILTTPTDECAFLLTETGRTTATDSCEDEDRFPPVVRIRTPQQTTYPVSAGSLPLDITIVDESGIAMAEVGVDDESASPETIVDLTTLGVGTHEVSAFAQDMAGNTNQERSVFVVVDDVPPALTITSPEPATYPVEGGPIPLEAIATDVHSAVASVRWHLDDADIEGTELLLDETWIGDHTVLVTATDDAGNVATSEVAFTVVAGSVPEPEPPSACGCRTSGFAPWWAALLALGLRRRRRAQMARAIGDRQLMMPASTLTSSSP